MALSAIGGSGRGVQVQISITEVATLLGAGQLSGTLLHLAGYQAELANGTADGSIDRVVSDAISFTTTPTDLDLVAGVPSKLTGATLTFAEIVGIAVFNDTPLGGTGNLLVGNATNPVAVFSSGTATLTVRPAGMFMWTDGPGITPTGGSTDTLRIVASAGTVVGRVMIWGRSA